MAQSYLTYGSGDKEGLADILVALQERQQEHLECVALKFGRGGWLSFEYDNRFGEDLLERQDGLLHLR